MDEQLERNKRMVLAFYDLMFNQCRPRDAIEKYVGAEYIQHNPGVVSGKQGFIDYFEEAAREAVEGGIPREQLPVFFQETLNNIPKL